MSYNRQLAAIMFTDIVGYSSMMQEDEDTTFQLLSKNRSIQRPLIEQYGGRWVKELGDGILATFTTVSDAVICAGKIIKACEPVEKLQLRIGIHQAEVIFQNDDVFGDGVNIAARIQAIAPVNGIYITESVQKNIANRKGFQATFVKEEKLKNINESIRLYEVKVDEWSTVSVPKTVPYNASSVSDKSVAVLPFVNLSNDPEQEYFSDGIAEEILYSLGKIRDLKVAGRTSSFQFKNNNTDAREIGEKLGVSTLLEGSVRKQGNRVRINVELINARDGYRLWAHQFEKTTDDVFALQAEIAIAVTKKLKITLVKNDLKTFSKPHTTNTEAYELYLKGRYYINMRGRFIIKGIECFKKAIEFDPDFALAHTGFADAILMAAFYGIVPPHPFVENAKQSADKALQLNPALCEPYCTLGYYSCLMRNWKDCEKYFKRSLEINPYYTQAHYWYGLNYMAWVKDDFNEAEKHGLAALQLEPLNAASFGIYGGILYTAGKFKEALKQLEAGLELDKNSFLCLLYKGQVHQSLSEYPEAIENYDHMMNCSNRHCYAQVELIATYCYMGNREMAQQLYEDLKSRADKEYIVPTALGISAAFLGEMDLAFQYFEKALQERDPILLTLKYTHWLSGNLRQEERFRQLLKRIGFPE